ncbi:hypothetical protein A1Q1_07635 [Trichosporon asahii var. asahii CBS 2479]|uniref:Dolichyl-diphosphooligosaccharide-protein glycosyltransferase subunit OST5 n=1 Tax=Trichosporon asahii var. asahii (strain ATCC 90039 / CBS 2479 / JCM 2466 / KCTC 7840 / NBRC 103889/ NCYC 2677 / UAMH 7654) TaxID=1186058 RepID=J5TJ51_TRIAS|nr:hypothetical protein A1Q1_07635 [Trichosporon asahii var. asahii CBS 2479]EJT51171.1 hypothetical protein A1Q1_07635 [Trichosporon asahii var. asahii CBS 2479]
MTYVEVKTLPAFSPLISVEALPTIALVALLAAFALTFFLTTLSKAPAQELGVALLAAFLAGAGTVALFCTVGVYV